MKIEHIALFTTNLEKTKEFFVKYFDAESNECYHNEKTGFRSYFLTFPEGARLEIMNYPETASRQPDDNYEGYHHIAFSVGSREKVDSLTKELVCDGCEVIRGPRVTGDGYYESCIRMDGFFVEITV